MEKNKKYITRIVEQVLDQIAELYLYFLAIYLVCLVFSLFFERWKLFFDWEIFHFIVFLFGVLSLMSSKGRQLVFSLFLPAKKLVKLKGLLTLTSRKEIIEDLFFKILKKTWKDLLSYLSRLKTGRLSKEDYIKIGVMVMILTYVLAKQIEPINFMILTYALISIFWIIESRIAAGIALVFLASCPILLILKKQPIAEIMAIYAYYFLVICVVTQMREYAKPST